MREAIAPVSVVVPCYRCSSTIERAVSSVAQQTVKPVEVILVNDASGDVTFTVLHQLEQQYPGWIKVLEFSDNMGSASARNAGWAVVTQPYVAFLDADDSWHPEKLRIQFEYMRNNTEVALCGHQCVYLSNGEILPVLPNNRNSTKIGAASLLFKNRFATPTVMLRSDIPFRFQEGKRCAEDLLLWQQIAFSGLQVARIESPLAYTHKPLYGAGGLSAQLWKMEGGELSNFVLLYKSGSIHFLLYALATCLSIVKFIKRLLVTKLTGLVKLNRLDSRA